MYASATWRRRTEQGAATIRPNFVQLIYEPAA